MFLSSDGTVPLDTSDDRNSTESYSKDKLDTGSVQSSDSEFYWQKAPEKSFLAHSPFLSAQTAYRCLVVL